ncbi:glycosyltransferase family 1 protein [Pseudoclavibacter sp. RFBG4]|uniref:glycosyltransferase family 4 protein n=1 Tax=Pseudoclavibacter sp. RFBG4 TaxID=2080575 RepID=UPI000CE735D7|nr:glycosyltransferase family 1 protein [Pseudoclavibacter sp. RFBG4]PPG35391.1 glycosyltransferase family 1 protein [Pseudoclavibacter sp. RFBG4]
MVTLRVLLDHAADELPGGTRRYSQELGRQLITRAPRGCDVEAIIPRRTRDEVALLEERVPGLTSVVQAPLRPERLESSWSRGLLTNAVGGGFIHSFTPLAPMRDISLSQGIDQTVVTWHDMTAFTHPELIGSHTVKHHKALLRRAFRYASGIVVPTNAVADQIIERFDFGDRVRVMSPAAASSIRLPESEGAGDAIADTLGLPDEYVLTLASLHKRHGLAQLVKALDDKDLAGVTLVVVGPTERGEVTLEGLISDSGVARDRVVSVGVVTDEQLAVALQRASALVVPSLSAGFGLPIIEAFKFGTPVITSDDPALVEVGLDATLVVERGHGLADSGYPERLAGAIAGVLGDSDLERRLRLAGKDRGGMFSWEIAADQVWNFHADL